MAHSRFPGHVEYFKSLSTKSSDPKWKIGLEAAELHAKYRSDNNTAHLHQIIKVLMPYRNKGTGFKDLWGNVLGSISNLSVNIQANLWNEIFEPENQGELPIDHNEATKAIIKRWIEMDQNKERIVNTETIIELAKENYKYFLKSEEQLILFYAIDQWYKTITPGFSLVNYVIELLRNTQ